MWLDRRIEKKGRTNRRTRGQMCVHLVHQRINVVHMVSSAGARAMRRLPIRREHVALGLVGARTRIARARTDDIVERSVLAAAMRRQVNARRAVEFRNSCTVHVTRCV